jgi:hypothetical protein
MKITETEFNRVLTESFNQQDEADRDGETWISQKQVDECKRFIKKWESLYEL